ncbi:IclR family transcriptional regulator domain-containing protein [Actibacterium sp. D379-3]
MTPDASAPHDRNRVQSVDHALRVIELLSTQPQGLSLTEVAEQTGLTRAGARRYLLTLVANGYAVQQGRHFMLSSRIVGIARQWLAAAPFWSLAQPYLRAVTEALDESCSAAVLNGLDVVYVARSASRHRVMAVQIAVGTHLPAYCTSMGQVLLAHLPQTALAGYLNAVHLVPRTDTTLTDRAALIARLSEVREQGYAVVEGELESGLCSIAVPIVRPDGEIEAALNMSAPSARMPAARLVERALPELVRARKGVEALFLL